MDLVDDGVDRRFALTHPATGSLVQLSAAAGPSSDVINQFKGGQADVYLDGFSFPKDVWILFVWARDLPGIAVGQAGLLIPGMNIPGFLGDRDGFLSRGVEWLDSPLDLDQDFPNSLTVLGGYLSVDENIGFDYDLSRPAEGLKVDFYSLVLHELAHAFGLCSRSVTEWRRLLDGETYLGAMANEVDESESGATGPLRVVGSAGGSFDAHFLDGTFQSPIFPLEAPQLVGTVPAGGLQDLLMERDTAIGGPVRRYEITKVDGAAMADMGWEVIDGASPAPRQIPVTIERPEAGGVRVIFDSEPGAKYSIQTSLDQINWVKVQSILESEGGQTDWTDGEEGFFDPHGAVEGSGRKFYRVVRPWRPEGCSSVGGSAG